MGAHASSTPPPIPSNFADDGESDFGSASSGSGDDSDRDLDEVPLQLLRAEVVYWRTRRDEARQVMLDAQRESSLAAERLAKAEATAAAAAQQNAALAKGTALICAQLKESGKWRKPGTRPPLPGVDIATGSVSGAGAVTVHGQPAAEEMDDTGEVPSTSELAARAFRAGAPVDGRPQRYYISGSAAAAARPATLAPRRGDSNSVCRPQRLRALAAAHPPRPSVGLTAEDDTQQLLVDAFFIGGVLPSSAPMRIAQSFVRRMSASGGRQCPGRVGVDAERVLGWWLTARTGYSFTAEGSHSCAAASFAQLALLHNRCTITREKANAWLEVMLDALDEVVPPPDGSEDQGADMGKSAADVAVARAALEELFRVCTAGLVKDF